MSFNKAFKKASRKFPDDNGRDEAPDFMKHGQDGEKPGNGKNGGFAQAAKNAKKKSGKKRC